MLVIGVGFLLLFGKALLPERGDVKDSYVEMARKYLVETAIKPGSELIGKSIIEAELRNLEGVFLIEIIRNEKVITPVSPEEKLEEGDTLIFSGVTSAISELTKPEMGLSLPKSCEIPQAERRIAEVVISQNSRLIGQIIQDSDFRGQYDASVLAVHRNRENLSGKIGEIEIKAGDVLLVLTGSDFYKRVEGIQPFYFISKEQGPRYVSTPKMLLIVLGLVLGIILHALGVFALFNSLLILVGLVLIMGIMPAAEIRKEMDFNLIILLALGLAFGRAMIESGAADYIADLLLIVAVPLGNVGVIGGLFLLTNLLSSYITNKAAVAIVFPVSIAMAQSLDHNVTPYILVVCFGAAASFITPIGYQTNLMVYGPGRYSFKDFFLIGFPLTLLYMVVCVVVLALMYN
jgi:di/tricarboxylate transporter